MKTCSLCIRWQSTNGLFALCPLREEFKGFRDGCVSWQATSEPRDVCEYCGRPKNSPNYAYHLCIAIAPQARELSPEATCEQCGHTQDHDPDNDILACENCGELIFVLEEEEKPIWMRSSRQGHILHLIASSGLALCGRQFDPQKTQVPKVTSTAPTLPYCGACMRADLALQTRIQAA